jgi:hypothetical protein
MPHHDRTSGVDGRAASEPSRPFVDRLAERANRTEAVDAHGAKEVPAEPSLMAADKPTTKAISFGDARRKTLGEATPSRWFDRNAGYTVELGTQPYPMPCTVGSPPGGTLLTAASPLVLVLPLVFTLLVVNLPAYGPQFPPEST